MADIPLPVHRDPSPTAPSISYAHSCLIDGVWEDMWGIGAGLYRDNNKNRCQLRVVNRTSPFNGTFESYIEVNTDDKAVRDLRLAYYAVISLVDAQFGRVMESLAETGLEDNTIVTFIGVRSRIIVMQGIAHENA